jgi:RHS repeat-associated protein
MRSTDLTKNGFGLPVTQSWTFNTLGAIATHVHPRPSGSATTLTVNDSTYTAGFLTNVTATQQGGLNQQIVSANYHQSGRLSDYTTGSSSPNVKTTIAADSVVPSRPLSFTSVKTGGTTLWSSGNYAYDTAYSPKAIGSTDTFAYDGRSRTTSATYTGTGGGTQGFTFDRYGNLTSKTGINPVTLTTDVTTNHLSTGVGAYDDRGNLVSFTSSAGTQTQAHDLLNRLYQTVDTSGTNFTYLYDGGGERVAKFPTGAGATRREFARIIIEARGDSPLSCTPDPFLDVTCAANPNDGKYVQKIKDIGISGGCGGGDYCPQSQTARDQAAVLFLKGKHCAVNVTGCTYTPPSCTTTHQFNDVPCPATQQEPFSDWIGELYVENITAGCGNNNFCPTLAVGSWNMLAWAQKIWPGYNPLPRASVVTYRDEGARVITEGVQSGSADASAVEAYQRDNVFLGTQLVSSGIWSGTSWTTLNYNFYAVDHLGSTRLVTDINGNSVQTLKYWPYGDDGPGTGSDAGQRLKFDGMERDSENDHYFDHARTHDFNIGRFISADMVFGIQQKPASLNRYAFALNAPLSLTDRTGLATTFCYLVPGNKGDGYEEVCVALNFGPGGDQGGSANDDNDGGNGKTPKQVPPPPSPLACFFRGAVVGAGATVAVGGLAIAAATVGVPAAVVSGALLLGGGIGGYFTLRNTVTDVAGGNYAAAAYDVGSLVGGGTAGSMMGGAVGDSINPPATRGWSPARDLGNFYKPSLGPVPGWLSTGPDQGAAAGATTASGSALSQFLSSLRGGC